jgi:hypothetical protein
MYDISRTARDEIKSSPSHLIAMSNYAKKNPEKMREIQKAFYLKNKKEILEKRRIYYANKKLETEKNKLETEKQI